MKLSINKKERGFTILGIILGVVVAISAIGIWSFSGQTNLTPNANASSDVQGSSLVSDAMSFKTMFNQYELQGISQDSIVYMPRVSNTPTQYNLLDPTIGISLKTPNQQMIRSNPGPTDGYWIFIKDTATSLGKTISASDFDKVMVVGGIKDSACKRINQALNGTETIQNLGSRSSSLLSGITKAAPYATSAIYFSPIPNMGVSGCAGHPAYPDDNLFYMAIKIN